MSHKDKLKKIAEAFQDENFVGSALLDWLKNCNRHTGVLGDFSAKTSFCRTTVNQEVAPQLVQMGYIILEDGEATLTEQGRAIAQNLKRISNR